MEARKPVGSSSSSSSSSSSFTSELFGSNDSYSPSSSKGIFGSIFAPSSKVLGRESLRSEVAGGAGQKKQDVNEVWNTKPGAPDNISRSSESEKHNIPNKDTSFTYQEERVQQPCHLSSSIYYGGQDIYSHPQSSQSSGSHSAVKMIQALLQEEIGGRDLSITKDSLPSRSPYNPYSVLGTYEY